MKFVPPLSMNPAEMILTRYFTGSMLISILAELARRNIPDLLGDKDVSPGELAQASGSHLQTLSQMALDEEEGLQGRRYPAQEASEDHQALPLLAEPSCPLT